jgi:hypothetical protein
VTLPRLYVDSALLANGGTEALATAGELGFETVVLGEGDALPESLVGAWHLVARVPAHGSPHWSRTLFIGPRPDPGPIALTGLRTARSLRAAVLELAAEHTLD